MTLISPFKQSLSTNKSEVKSSTLIDPFKRPVLPNLFDNTQGQQSQPGFLESLKNPIDLWKYDSIPMSLYYWMSGNTKQKQARDAKSFIDSFPNKIGTSEYDNAEKILKHYSHTLSSEPFNTSALVEAIKTNPKMFGAEMVNMLVADPYLLAPWFWGGWAMKAAQASKVGSKMISAAPKISSASIRTAGSVPTLTAYSSIHQLSEDGNIDAKRLATETAFGGAAIFAMSALFGGATGKLSKTLGIKPEDITPGMRDGINKYWIDKLGPEKAKPHLIPEEPTLASVESATKSFLDGIEDGAIGFNPNLWKFIPGKNVIEKRAWISKKLKQNNDVSNKIPYGYLNEKGIWRNKKTQELYIDRTILENEFNLDPFKKYFADVDDYISFKAEVVRLKNSPAYKNRNKWYNEDLIKDEALDNHIKRSYESNLWKQAVHAETKPFLHKAWEDISIAQKTKFYHINNLKGLKTPAVTGTILGTGSYLVSGDDESFWTGALLGAGSVSVWKIAGRILTRNNSLKTGKRLTELDPADNQLGTRLSEIKQSLPKGMKLEDVGLRNSPSFYTNPKIQKSDLRLLGRAEEVLLSESKYISSSLLDNYRNFFRSSMIDASRIHRELKSKVPDDLGGRKITDYLQGDKAVKLSAVQLEVAKDLREIFNAIWKSLDTTELRYRFHENFLPGFWNMQGMGDANIAKAIRDMIKNSGKSSSLKGFAPSEFQKVFPTYQAGIDAGFKPITTNAIDILGLYIDKSTTAIAQRRLVSMMKQATINGRSDGVGGVAKIMYASESDLAKTKLDPRDYMRFYHRAFIDKNIDVTKYNRKYLDSISPYILREAEPVMRMLFDAREEGAVLKAISNFNFLQKRFSVGYSFFHAGALLQSSIYMSMHPISAGKMFMSATGAGNIAPFKWFIPKWKDNTAQKMLMQDGNGDMLKAATRAGVEFSHPEDIGWSNFYQTWSGAKNYLDKHPSWISYLAKAGITNLVEKPFKYIDMVTWDRVFNAGKLYAWQTNVMKLLNNPKFSKAPLNEIYKQAAIVTNDGYGGLNWQQLYMSTNDPILKKMKEYAYRPTGRKWMQRIMFAPDWTTANFRIISRAFPGINDNAMSRSLYQAYTIRAALIVGTGGAALQQMFTGTSILDNKDPTRVELGNGFSISFSKQLFEPLHWATHPFKYAIAKQSSILKSTEQALFNKKFLTSPWPSPISKADILSLQRAYDYAGHYGMSFVPFSFRPIVEEIAEEGGISPQDALGEILRSLGGLTGYPIYPIGKQDKYPGIKNLFN